MDPTEALKAAAQVDDALQRQRSILLVGDVADARVVMGLLNKYLPITTVLGHVGHWQSHFGFLTVMPRPNITMSDLESSLRLLQQYKGLMLIPNYELFSNARQQLIFSAFETEFFGLVGGVAYGPLHGSRGLDFDPFYSYYYLTVPQIGPAQKTPTTPRRVLHKDSWQDDDSFDGVDNGLMDLPSFRRPR